ncbi:MAG: sugar nucleotide-binding protein, partial [Candidatus Omnitrophica bacterium]|nr:sugar nucleotide-binding protein [Candidatus Omnitrophota bacterium]
MLNRKKRILITGVSGLLGNNLAFYFKDDYDVLGLYREHPVFIAGIQVKKADILSIKSLKSTVDEFCPDIVIHCASLTDVDFCENNPGLTRRVNVSGSRLVTQSLKNKNTKLVYISTDSVYDGVKGNFKETDKVKPRNLYGFTKLKGEEEVLNRPGSLVLRTNIFGWNIQDKSSIAEWIVSQLSRNKQVNGFEDA